MKLMIGMPVRDRIHAATQLATDFLRLGLAAEGIGLIQRREGRGSLPLAHSLIANAFMQSDATHLLIVHADVSGFTPADVVRMMRSGKDLIGAPLPGRTFEPERVARALAVGVPPEDAWKHAAPQLWWEREKPRYDADAGCLEVAAMSTGFLMMTRAAIEAASRSARRMKWEVEDFVHVFEEDLDDDSRQLMSEDKAFCARCDQEGISCWADTRTALIHWGEASFHAAPLASLLVPRSGELRHIPMIVKVPFACPPTCEAEAREIFAGAYDLPIDFPPDQRPTILDLGANVGAFARYAILRWPGAVVDCYEPQGGPVGAALRANVVYGMGTYETAIVPEPGVYEVEFAVRPHQPTGSHVAGAIEAAPGEERIKVRAMDAASLASGVILKIDVEGREPEILARYFDAKDRSATRGVIAEWHSDEARDALRLVLERHHFRILDERPMRPDRTTIGVMRAVRDAA